MYELQVIHHTHLCMSDWLYISHTRTHPFPDLPSEAATAASSPESIRGGRVQCRLSKYGLEYRFETYLVAQLGCILGLKGFQRLAWESN